jgi:polysaccharide deacetylase 2 family uncharacterized protein YibQ
MMALSEPTDTRARRPLLIAAGGVALLLVLLVLWLVLSGPPAKMGVTVAVAPPVPAATPPVATTAPAESPPADTATMEQQTAPQPTGKLPDFNGGALLPAPDTDLIEKGANGFLPVIGHDGRKPWQVYARPFDLADKRPRVAILINDLGPSATMIDTAINHLPGGVSLGFVPYRARLGEWINLARASGHEVLLNLPMEPVNYPTDDPGPEALLTALDPPTNQERLNWVLSQATGYVGLVGLMGSRFSTSHDDMLPVLQALQHRGLLYVDNRASPQSVVPDIAGDIDLAVTFANRQLDQDQDKASIDKKLAELEDIAKRNGGAVGLSHPIPVVMERVAVWAQTVEDRGVVLAPVSAVIDKTKLPTPAPKMPAPAEAAPKDKPAPAGKAAPPAPTPAAATPPKAAQ